MILVYILLAIGVIFQIFGTSALHRFPDVYTRIHGTTISTTFGSIFLYLAIIIYGGSTNLSLSIHVFLIALILLITNPTASHAIARAAYQRGIHPQSAVVDHLKKKIE